MSDEVSRLRGGAPLLSDIPGQLRAMANQIESGEVAADAALFVLTGEPQDWPRVYGWGRDMGDAERIGTLALAQAFFVANQTERAS